MNATLIIPTLNPDSRFPDVVAGLLAAGFPQVIVVNDGSAAEYLPVFRKIETLSGVTLLTHDENYGKGRALKTAFSYCISQGCTGSVITVDSDGQHLPDDVVRCAETLQAHPDDVVLGVRAFRHAGVPARSRFGNLLTSLIFRFACGIRISDTQTGLRAFPVKYLPLLCEIKGERYEYETEMLLELNRQNVSFREVTIQTVYIDQNKGSHFHPLRDSFRVYRVILKFMLSSVLSFLIDYGIFTLLVMLFAHRLPRTERLFLATVTARVISSLFNFTMNKRLVFRSDASTGSTMLKYYVLCAIQTALSYGLVYIFSSLLQTSGFWESLIKICADAVLFFISFHIQRRFVFRNNNTLH